MSIQRWLASLFVLGVIWWGQYHKGAWFGWSKRDVFSPQGLKVFATLGLPAAFTAFADVLG